MTNNKILLQAAIDGMWAELRAYEKEFSDFFSGKKSSKRTVEALLLALKLVISEYALDASKYSKYSPDNYTKEDFIKLAATSPSDLGVNMEDIEECKKFMEELREVMWGYELRYIDDLPVLMERMCSGAVALISFDEEDFNRLRECAMIARLENFFRLKELQFLEQESYKEKDDA